ncbi:unnamed protein product [Cuscuta epithymum]|uniref:Transcription factor CBF/NF-Y/archaeal histone domain-containing protein n=1 Tax=Cuscuta epithymum TaxID=186058 RepID=A0AAV0G8A6_9ASTE|nr:unnamed protein product [Cuscuta epithymum]
MAKNQGVADTSRAKKVPLKGSQTKKNRKSASGSSDRIVIVNDDELETAAVPSNSTESENGDLRGSEDGGITFIAEEQEEDDAEEYENGDIQFLYDEKTGNTDEKEAGANSNGNVQKMDKCRATKTRGSKKEKQSERVVSKAKSKAGTSQQTTNAKNSKAKKNENQSVQLTKNGKNEKEKKSQGNKNVILKTGESSSMKKNEKSSQEESKANTKNSPRKGKSNGDEEKMQKGKKRVEEDEEVSGKVAKKAKGSSTSGDKSPSSTEKNGKKGKEKKSEGNKDVILKTGKTSSMKNEESRTVESNGNTKSTPRKGKSNGNEEKMKKRKERVEEDEEVCGKIAKKAKGSNTSSDKRPSKTAKNGPIKKKEILAEEDEEGRGTVVAKKVKSNGQTRGSKDTAEKKDIKDEKKVENGETKVSQSNRRMKEDDEHDGDEEDAKCESTLYKFPMSRIARIIKSEVSDAKLSQEATFVINKATEKFLDLLCKEAYACAFLDHKPYVGYDHLSSAICKRKRFEFLSDFVPERIKAEVALADFQKLG